ncbi:maleate cis-trans isomerase family protein [Curvivirga aplysinae]|uniref:maleate cis-trans isomerase family protein n=1 Tax=Curvivirga aplysinae TaxID=2529852 RepID=UPI0012BB91C9|nr:aspartate/glutamate racemase family protein [Curvivirga aplysinae]MTI09962.1 Asp/Glu racemase [Curvivirga aplysinae]
MEITKINPDYPKSEYFSGKKLGLIALATDHIIEDNLREMLDKFDVSILTNRIIFDGQVTQDSLAAMAQDLERATYNLLPDKEIDVIAYGCSSGTAAIGEDRLREEIQKVKPNAKVTNPITAATEAFQALNVKKLSLLTPYIPDVNRKVGETFAAKGMEILNIAGFGVLEDADITRIDPDAIVKEAKACLHPSAEALFLSCTAMRSIQVIETLEKELSIPVVSSNQAIAWHGIRLMGHRNPSDKWGRLFQF